MSEGRVMPPRRYLRACVAVMLLSAVVVAYSQATAQAQVISAGRPDLGLFITLQPAPTNVDLFRGNDQAHVAYELLVSNFTSDPVSVAITALTITGMTRRSSNVHNQAFLEQWRN